MATPPAGMVGIRDWLRRQGVPDEAIGWQDGTVTLYGRPFFRPSVNVEGRTYARPQDLPDVAQFRLSTGAFNLPQDFRVQPRPFSPQVQEAINDILRLSRRGGFTAEEIMRSPEWQATQRVLDFERGQRQAALRRDLASRGMLRSSPAVQAMAAEEARFEAARAEALPQLLQAAYARQAQDLQQRLAALQAATELERQAFQQGLAEFEALAPFRFLTPAQQISATGMLPGGGLTLAGRQALAELGGIDPLTGQLTLAGRQVIAELTGVDPVTGQPTFAAREAQANRALQRARLATETALTPQDLAVSRAWENILAGRGTEEDFRIVGRTPPSRLTARDDEAAREIADLYSWVAERQRMGEEGWQLRIVALETARDALQRGRIQPSTYERLVAEINKLFPPDVHAPPAR